MTGDIRRQRLWYSEVALNQWSLRDRSGSFNYSNSGYVVAAAMMEAATGSAWEKLVQAEVFAPLDLGSAGIGPVLTGYKGLGPSWGHRRGFLGGRFEPAGESLRVREADWEASSF